MRISPSVRSEARAAAKRRGIGDNECPRRRARGTLGRDWRGSPGSETRGTGASSAGCLVDVLRSLGRVGGLLGVTRALAGVGLVRVRLLGLAARRLLVLLLGLVDLLPRLLHDAHRSSSVSLGV